MLLLASVYLVLLHRIMHPFPSNVNILRSMYTVYHYHLPTESIVIHVFVLQINFRMQNL